jgi:hypothetical protein
LRKLASMPTRKVGRAATARSSTVIQYQGPQCENWSVGNERCNNVASNGKRYCEEHIPIPGHEKSMQAPNRQCRGTTKTPLRRCHNTIGRDKTSPYCWRHGP